MAIRKAWLSLLGCLLCCMVRRATSHEPEPPGYDSTHMQHRSLLGILCCSRLAAIEGINKIKGGNLKTPSEQMLVDCDVKNGNEGCRGGLMDTADDEKSLQSAVAKQPISVAIDAGFLFQFYSSGVFLGYCGTNLNHGVTVVGYGEQRGRKYWIVKNSWGSDWGEHGYVRTEHGSRDMRGKFGIAMKGSYPVLS